MPPGGVCIATAEKVCVCVWVGGVWCVCVFGHLNIVCVTPVPRFFLTLPLVLLCEAPWQSAFSQLCLPLLSLHCKASFISCCSR